jgi:Fe-S oxidoreductase
MQSIRQHPVKMAQDAIVSLFPIAELEGGRISTRIIGTCLQCGACGDFCPAGIDMEKFFSDFRNMMAEDGTWPLPFHDFFIQDYQFTEGDGARVARKAPDGRESGYAFFPGCQLGGTNPEAVKKAYASLLENMPGTSLMMMCCGVPLHWGGQAALFQEHLDRLRRDWASLGKPTLILACATCQKTFERFLPDMPVVSLYEILAGSSAPSADSSAAPAAPSVAGVQAVVFDPCSSRKKAEIQQSVRRLAQGAGYVIEELENHGEEAECCGYGGHAHFTKPGYTGAIAAKRAGQSDLPYLVYCANCRESFAEQGKECRHILDVVFGLDSRREALTKSDRRQNRRQLKADMLSEFWGEKGGAVYSPYGSLAISSELRAKLSRNYIVADDMLHAIREAEEGGSVLYDPDTDTRIAHLRVGDRTYWTLYRKDADGGYELKNAYSHRLNIEE